MGLFDGYLFCTDMDGTLTVDGRVSEENQKAIRYFQSEGGLFTVSTGRDPGYVRTFAEQFVPNTYIIATNGTIIYDPFLDQTMYEDPLEEEAFEIVEYAERAYPYMMEVHTTFSMTESSDRFDPKQETALQHRKSMKRPWYKIIFVVPAERSAETIQDLIRKFGDRYNFDRSWPEGIEMHSKTSGKGACIEWMRKKLGDRARIIIGAGDYENDLTMLAHADIGYAVANAIDIVREQADRVTVANTEHAIAHIIEELKEEILEGKKNHE